MLGRDLGSGHLRSWMQAIFPASCLACGARLRRPRPPLLLCPICRGGFERLSPEEHCRACARKLPLAARSGLRCLDCIAHPPPYDALFATWRYEGALAQVVRALKFRRLDYLAEELAAAAVPFARAVRGPGTDLVVPVPLAPLRRLERGFNQAERLARHLADDLELPLAEPLRRRGFWAVPQSRLGRAGRSSRLDRRFVPAGGRPSVAGARVLLVDDVVTTGATLRAAAAVLQSLGVESIVCWTLAATPEPGFVRSPSRN